MRWLILACVLVGCASSSSRPIRGPDGKRGWWAIECKRSKANCFDEAGEVCPRGYDVADTSGQHGTYVMANAYSAMAVPIYKGEMIVKCR